MLSPANIAGGPPSTARLQTMVRVSPTLCSLTRHADNSARLRCSGESSFSDIGAPPTTIRRRAATRLERGPNEADPSDGAPAPVELVDGARRVGSDVTGPGRRRYGRPDDGAHRAPPVPARRARRARHLHG